MKYKKALNLYLNKTVEPRRQIKFLQGWNENLTLQENVIKCGMTIPGAYQLKHKYNLKCVRKRRSRNKVSKS